MAGLYRSDSIESYSKPYLSVDNPYKRIPTLFRDNGFRNLTGEHIVNELKDYFSEHEVRSALVFMEGKELIRKGPDLYGWIKR